MLPVSSQFPHLQVLQSPLDYVTEVLCLPGLPVRRTTEGGQVLQVLHDGPTIDQSQTELKDCHSNVNTLLVPCNDIASVDTSDNFKLNL